MRSIFILSLARLILSDDKEMYISNINVLLPISHSREVVFEIEAFNGCFSWTSSASNVIEVLSSPDVQGCSNRATLRVATKDEFSQIVWIQATDRQSKQVLLCEAKVAKI